MLKRTFFLLAILSAFAGHLQAQTDTLVVKAVQSKVTVAPERSFLYLNENNWFRITYTGKNKLGRIELKGGTVEQKDSLYNFKATTGVSAILVVYEKLKNGTEKIAFTWTYKLYGRDVPRVYLDGVPNDSVADKFRTIAMGRLQAKQKYGTDQYTVTSFRLYIPAGGKFDTLSTTGNQLTPEMKKKIDAMDIKNAGGILMFDNIKANGPNGKEIELPPLRIYLQDSKQIRIGL